MTNGYGLLVMSCLTVSNSWKYYVLKTYKFAHEAHPLSQILAL